MTLGEVWSYGLGNLKRHKLRTGLTLMGVAIGIAALTLLVSLGSGLKEIFSSQFDSEDLVVRINVLRGGTKKAVQSGVLTGGHDPEGAPVTDEVIDDLRKLEGVVAAYPQLTAVALGHHKGRLIAPLIVDGVPTAALTESYQSALLAGTFWEVEDAKGVCVFPSLLLEDLGYTKPAEAVGQTLKLTRLANGRRFKRIPETQTDAKGKTHQTLRFEAPDDLEVLEVTVIGVYDSKPFGYSGRWLLAPSVVGKEVRDKHASRPNTLPEGEYPAAVIKVASHEDVQRVKQEVEAKGFDTQTVFDVLRMIGIVFTIVQVVLGFFGGIGLAVAFFGIANTMLMAVMERTREIGTLKALGARDRDIRRIFVLEAAAIGLMGGALGLGAGWAAGAVLNAIAGTALGSNAQALGSGLFRVELWLSLGAIGVATAVAILAGLYPARRASRMNPVEALRRE